MGSIWVFWALMSAFTTATNDALTKHVLKKHDEYLIAWLRLSCALPFLLPLLFFVPIPVPDQTFFLAYIAAIPLEVAAIVLYVKALKLSPLGLTVPFLSLTPIFLIVVPYAILKETVSITGTIGVVLIGGGSYILNVKGARKGIIEPLRMIVREKGSLCMIAVALIYSLTATLGKVAIEHSSPIFFAVFYTTGLALALGPLALYKNRGSLKKQSLRTALKAAILPGICHSTATISHMIAISLTQVAYMISVKRLSLLIGVIYGYIFFNESNFADKFLGAFIMFTGFVLIVLFR
ncbi:MAG: EamA-like transporter family protein [Syntrophorhabdus sp. PtaU1.Bin050]|nr:MAG: EamA-like transporter family protein [Syntrophorhabdus sp. PtaU1.Bin050]